jgi:phosphohistidine swiveling domain-containing protein
VKTRILMMFMVAALIVGCQATRLSPPILPFADELQEVLDDGLKASNGAGISAAVIVPGYQPWVGVSGYSAVGPDGFVPMWPDMLFQIASIEKTFTAALMLQLVEEGRLSLDDPVSRWVSGYDQIDPSITIRQLLNHTSDIYDWEDNPRSFSGLYQSEGYQAIDWSHFWILDDVMAAGQAEGRVRILNSPEEGCQLQPGEILVAVTTNVGWTPISPRAAAVITDVGAPLSHAAIVARELGIPAMVGCGDATMCLKTGDRVRVDGGRGIVNLERVILAWMEKS